MTPEGNLPVPLLLQLVEVVIGMGSDGHRISQISEGVVAASCLRVYLAGQECIDGAAARAVDLIGAFE
ncbi:hypothetical protein [Nocardioides sp. NPDC006273]|uniref:hypothetical protein n=1 Tax=Nocardioides sp. NPDC006273 TaxID=3155598 RepID=UPI0033BDC54B